MENYFKDKSEILVAILIFVLGILNKEIFGDVSIIYTIASFVAIIVLWDFVKLLIFNSTIFPMPKWLYYSHNDNKKAFPFRSIHVEEESVPDDSTIYLVTSNLTLDVSSPATIEVVKRNLSRGVHYTFLTSDDDESMRRINKLKNIHIDNIKNVNIYAANLRVVQVLSSDNIMIFSMPTAQNKGFFQIPDGTGRWWAEMSPEATEIYYTSIKISLAQFSAK